MDRQIKHSKRTILSLGVMMFMQYMLMAVWWVPLAAYLANLNLTSIQKSLILSSMAIGSMASPVIGMLADRYFASEKVLAASNFVTGGLLVLAANTSSPSLLMLIIILAMLSYMPTWSLTSSVSMAHAAPEQFPRIRMFGSIGWVASGVFSLVAVKVFKFELFDGGTIPFYCGAGVSFVAAGLNLFLPTTPPVAKGRKASLTDTLGLRAFTMLKDRNFLVFMVLSVISIVPFSLYHVYGSEFLQSLDFQFITFTMNLGQLAEIFFMIIATTIIIRLGIKWALVIGLIALCVRYFSFYFGIVCGQNSLHIVGILVHGLIFGLFYVGGQVYADKKAPKELKAQAQGFLAFVVWGVGLFIATFFNGWLINNYSSAISDNKIYQWDKVMGISSLISIAVLVLFVFLFRREKEMVSNEIE